MKKNYFLLFFLFLVQTVVFSHSIGDYRSIASGNWNSLSNWEYFNGSNWVTPSGTSPQGYPGQYIGTGTVTISDGNNITIDSSTPNDFSALVIGQGSSGILTVGGNVTVKTLSTTINAGGIVKFSGQYAISFPVGASINIVPTGKIDDGGTCNNNVAVYIGPVKYAVCKGGGNAEFTFEKLNTGGGTLSSNPGYVSPVCGNTISLIGGYTGILMDQNSAVSYLWTASGPSSVTFNSNTIASPLATINPSAYPSVYIFTLKVTNGSISNSKTISITVNAIPETPTLGTVTQPTCSTATGNFTITNYSGSNTYTFSPTGPTVSGTGVVTASAGTYTVTASANGCSSAASSSLTVNAQPATPAQPTLSSITQPSCSTATGSFTITNYSGSNTYTFSPTGPTVNGTGVVTASTGTYTVTATANGCTSVASLSLTVNAQPATPAAPIASAQTFCSEDFKSVNDLVPTGTNIKWYDVNTGGAALAKTTPIVSGTYYASQTVNGCESARTAVTVTVNPASVGGSLAGNATVCSGTNSSTLTLSGHTGSVVRWESSLDNFATAGTPIANTTTSLTVTNLTATTSYRAVVQSGSCSSVYSLVGKVTVDPTSVGGSLAGNATVCSGTNSSTFTLSGHTGSVVRWESSLDNFATAGTPIANTTTSLTVTNLTATTSYRAVVQSGSCAAINSGVGKVTVNPANTVSAASVTPTLCINAALTAITHTTTGATGIGAATNLPAGVTATFGSNTITISGTPTASGTFDYSIPLVGGCGTVSATGRITVSAPIAQTITGTNAVCIGSTTAFASTTPGGTWSSATPAVATVDASTGVVTGVTAGTSVINYSVTTAGGCVNTASETVTVSLLPMAKITAGGATTFCEGGSVVLTASAGDSYLWSTGATTQAITVSTTGNYNVKVTDALGCQSVASANTAVTVNPLPVTPIVTISTQPTCSIPTATVLLSGLPAGNWTINPGGITGTGSTTTISGLAAGATYNFTVATAGGCTSNPVAVTINSYVCPAADSGTAPSTGGTAIANVLSNDTTNGAPSTTTNSVISESGSWPAGISLNTTTGAINVAAGTAAGVYNVAYQLCDKLAPSACATATATITIPLVAVESPSIALVKTAVLNDEDGNGSTQVGETISYTLVVTNTGNVALTNVIVKDVMLGFDTTTASISLAVGENKEYQLSYSITQDDIDRVEVVNTASATAESPAAVRVSDEDTVNTGLNLVLPESVVKVYNAVSPNGDGFNDVFRIEGLQFYPENTVEIYNRWGVLVFERERYNNDDRAFRGRSEGRVTVKQAEELPTGTYFYILKYKDNEKNTYEKSGYLYINR